MQNRFDISVIIPIYKVEDFIEECINSIIQQKKIQSISIEVILIDDASPDASMHITRRILNSYNGNIVFRCLSHSTNRGLSAARNTGIEAAQGEYLFFLDSDDWIAPHCLSTLWTLKNQHADTELICGQTVSTPNAFYLKDYFDYKAKQLPGYCNAIDKIPEIFFKTHIAVWNKLINRQWLVRNGLYFKEGLIYEDYHWQLRAYKFINSISIDLYASPTYFYRDRSNSIMKLHGEDHYDSLRHIIYMDIIPQIDAWDSTITGILNDLQIRNRRNDNNPFYRHIFNEISSAINSNGFIPYKEVI